ncbi:YcxB family protein [Microbacterium sp. LWO12-1.2]|uniref:YcxB family protein n=1 Tax=Microbacterium sp. LWO12-1.2 TaxID=3135261 RepID=UPI00341F28A8
MSTTPRSLTVDESLLRRMANDATVYSLTRPLAIVMWVALAGAFVLSILNLNARVAAGPDEVGLAAWMPPVILGLAAYAIVLSVSSARRAVRAAMPPETVVWVALGDDVLQMGSGRRRSDIRYSTFQSMRAGKDAVLFKLRDASAATAIPRALLTDDDIVTLRAKIG